MITFIFLKLYYDFIFIKICYNDRKTPRILFRGTYQVAGYETYISARIYCYIAQNLNYN